MIKKIILLLLVCICFTWVLSQQAGIYGNPELTWDRPESIKNLKKSHNTQLSINSSRIKWNYLGKPWGANILNLQRMSNGIFYLRTEYDSWYRSTNNGDSWKKLNSNIDLSEINKIFEGKNNNLYIKSSEGLYKSIDNGYNWEMITDRSLSNFYISQKGYFLSNTDSLLFISQNNGISWEKNEMPGKGGDYLVPFTFDSKDKLFYIDSPNILYFSNNYGKDWELYDTLEVNNYFAGHTDYLIKKIEIISDTLMLIKTKLGKCFKYSLTSNKLKFIRVPGTRYHYAGISEDNIIWAYSENKHMDLKFYLRKSSDFGKTWQTINSIYVRNGLGNSPPIRFDDNSYICNMARKGLRRSIDGGENWEPIEKGLDYNIIVSLAAINQEHIYAGTIKDFFYGGIYSYQGDNIWHNILENKETGMVWEINYRKARGHIITYSRSHDKILRNIDMKESWSTLNSLSWNPGSDYPPPTYYSSYMDINGNLYTSINDWGIYHMKYNGMEWTLGRSGLPNDYVFFIDEDCSGNIIAKTWRSGDYYKSSDGKTWEKTDWTFYEPNSFCVIDSTTIYGCSDYGLYKSNDNCRSWRKIRNGNFLKAIYIPELNCLICAVYGEGVGISYDGGDSWSFTNDNDYFKAIRDLEMDLNGNIYIATERGGVYYTDYFKSKIDSALIPSQMQINNVYPNPSNSSITINLAIDKEQDLQTFIYDLKGRLLIDNKFYFMPGRYNKHIDISSLPTGIYFLKILSNEKQKIIKFTVIK